MPLVNRLRVPTILQSGNHNVRTGNARRERPDSFGRWNRCRRNRRHERRVLVMPDNYSDISPEMRKAFREFYDSLHGKGATKNLRNDEMEYLDSFSVWYLTDRDD